MKEIKCVLNLEEKDFTTDKGDIVKYIDMKVKLDNGITVPVKCTFKQDKKVVKVIYNQV